MERFDILSIFYYFHFWNNEKNDTLESSKRNDRYIFVHFVRGER